MTRPVIVLLLGLAAGSARAQTPTCTYDTCALRLRETFFGGSSVVQGPRRPKERRNSNVSHR